MFCAACIHGVTAALVSPRQLTPMTNPSGSSGSAGLISVGDELVVAAGSSCSARSSHGVMLLRPAFSEK